MIPPLKPGASLMPVDGPFIETARLILRPWRESDIAANTAMLADPDAARFITPDSKAVTTALGGWRNAAVIAGHFALHGFTMFAVEEKSSGRYVGRVGPWSPPEWPGFEVGWGIAREHWGKGYASEGAAAAMDYAFDVLGWDDVIHCIHVDNAASQGVAKKLGSRNLRRVSMPVPYENEPVDAWGQARAEWKRSHQRARLMGTFLDS